MIHDELPGVELHNVVETEPADWADGGHALRRVPRSVRENVNVDARERYRHPSGSELRFVPTDDGPVEVTLSGAAPTVVYPFWGPFQPDEPVEIGPEPTTLSLSVPEQVADLRDDVPTGPFDRRVCRVRFDGWEPAAVHDVSGARRPPESGEVPDRRLLAYGTSITEGAAASARHITYTARLGRSLGADVLNLGASGSAFCEPAIGEYVAERGDWDVATLAISVNMANRGFTDEQFARRADRIVNEVAAADPDRPVVAVTLFPYHDDLVAGEDPDRAATFREAVRTAVAESPHDNLHHVSGPDLMDATGLTTDVLHPGDAGHTDIADGLADAIGELLD
ncbi:MAG: SGNH/GDSL hydrolase family protein [Haloarculaceae archaeon]